MADRSMDQAAIREVLAAAKALAARYYALTGKPLGVTGEVAEAEAAEKLDLMLAPPRHPDYDASRETNGSTTRHQIKGRAVDPSDRYRGRVPSIEYDREFDLVTLVLLDRTTYCAIEMWQASRQDVRARLQAPGSKARTERNSMAISQFISIAQKVWPQQDQAATLTHLRFHQQKAMTRQEAIFNASRQCRSTSIQGSNTHFSSINSSKNVWWLDIPREKLTTPLFEQINLLLYDDQPAKPRLHHLVVPVSYLRQNLQHLRIRTDNNKISLELSANTSNIYDDVIGAGRLSFRQFLHCDFNC